MKSAYRPLSRLRWWRALGLAYVAAIVALSLLPPRDLPVDPGDYDKLWHAAGYALAAAWTVWIVTPDRRFLYPRLGALIVLGIVLEGVQHATGFRTGDPMDALANALGVVAGGGIVFTPLAEALEWVDDRLARR